MNHKHRRVALSLVFFLASCVVSTPRGLYQRSVEAIAQGEYDRGISGLSRAIESDPKFAEAYVSRGIAYAETGNINKAIADYQTALTLNPKLVDAHYNLGNAHMQAKSYEKAIASYSETLKHDPNYAYALGNRGNAYDLMGETQKAIADLNAAAKMFASQGNDQAAKTARLKLAELQKSDTVEN